MCLICKDKLECSLGVDQAFPDLKIAFTMAPILIHPNFSKPFFIESNTFEYDLGAILSQNREDK